MSDPEDVLIVFIKRVLQGGLRDRCGWFKNFICVHSAEITDLFGKVTLHLSMSYYIEWQVVQLAYFVKSSLLHPSKTFAARVVRGSWLDKT